MKDVKKTSKEIISEELLKLDSRLTGKWMKEKNATKAAKLTADINRVRRMISQINAVAEEETEEKGGENEQNNKA